MKALKIILIACIVSFLGACKKYEDGPFFSLRSKNNRLKGTWELVELTGSFSHSQDGSGTVAFANGIFTETNDKYPETDTIYTYSEIIEIFKDGTYTYKEQRGDILLEGASNWKWLNAAGNKQILDIQDGPYIVRKLTNKEMILEVEESSVSNEFYYDYEEGVEKQGFENSRSLVAKYKKK